MDVIQTVSLGVVQGLTELLPVSSSGHLLLFSDLVLSKEISSLFLTSLHLGTTIAIIIAYREFFFKNLFDLKKVRTISYMALATVPAAFLGLTFNETIESNLRGSSTIITMLIIIGILMIWVDNSKLFEKNKIKKWEEITWWQALLIGFGQALALIPGTSRSGASALTGIFLGIEKFKALEYSFLLGAPILLGSFLYEAASTPNAANLITQPSVILGVLVAGITGFFSIRLLQRFSKRKFLTFFGLYRVVLSLVLLLLL